MPDELIKDLEDGMTIRTISRKHGIPESTLR